MAKKGGSTPAPPPASQTISEQQAANSAAVRESARVNAVDTVGPYGQTTYERGEDGVPVRQVTTLNPGSQYIYDRQQDIGKTLADTAYSRLDNVTTTPYTTQGLPYNPGGYNTASMPSFSAQSVGRNGQQMGGWSGAFGTGPHQQMASPPPSLQQPQAAPTGIAAGSAPKPAPQVSDGTTPGTQMMPPPSLGGGIGSGAMGTGGAPLPQPGEPNEGTGPLPGSGQQPYSPATGPRPATGQAPAAGQPSAPSTTGAANVMPYDPRSYGNMDYFSNNVGDAMFSQGMSRVMPQIEQANRQFDQQMADRGIPIGSDAYNRARSQLDRGQNDLVTSLVNSSTTGALGATQGIVGLEQGLRSTSWNENLQGNQQSQADWLQRMQIEQNIRGSLNQENLTERNQAINEVSAILQGSPALGMPNAPNIPTYQVAAPDVIGAHNSAFNGQMQSYQAQQQQRNAMWQGAFGVAGALAGNPTAMGAIMR
jgi:hypothetical protein